MENQNSVCFIAESDERFKNKKTLEEVAERLTHDFPVLEVRFNMTNEEINGWFLEALQKGAKWKQERSYSEEEVLKIIHNYRNSFELYRNIQVLPDMFFKWFEQFKKK